MTDGAAPVDGNPFAAPKAPGGARGPYKKRSHHKKAGVPGATKEVAPKRQEPQVVPKYVYEGVGVLVLAANAGANFALPRIKTPTGAPMWEPEDQLTGTEIGALVRAAGDEVLTNRELAIWFTRLGKAAGNNAHAKLAMVLIQIAYPRLARRGMLPEEFLSVINAIGATGTAPAPAPETPVGAPPDGGGFDYAATPGDDIPPVSVASGRTPDDDGGHGEREVQPGEVPEPGPSMVRDVPQQGGHRRLRRQADQNGGGVVESEVSAAGAVARA